MKRSSGYDSPRGTLVKRRSGRNEARRWGHSRGNGSDDRRARWNGEKKPPEQEREKCNQEYGDENQRAEAVEVLAPLLLGGEDLPLQFEQITLAVADFG